MSEPVVTIEPAYFAYAPGVKDGVDRTAAGYYVEVTTRSAAGTTRERASGPYRSSQACDLACGRYERELASQRPTP